jgi:hypothetical protein
VVAAAKTSKYIAIKANGAWPGGSNDPQGRTASFWPWWRRREDDASE